MEECREKQEERERERSTIQRRERSVGIWFNRQAQSPGSLRSVHEAIDAAPHCFIPWRHPDPHPDVFFSSKYNPE